MTNKKNDKIDVIDTGLVCFDLNFDRGKEEIFFNPNDPEFFARIETMFKNIENLYKGLAEKTNEGKDGEDVKGTAMAVAELNKALKNELDIAFGNEISPVVFKYVSPNAIIKSVQMPYIFYFLDYIAKKIEEETGRTAKIMQKAVAEALKKHGGKYIKKIG